MTEADTNVEVFVTLSAPAASSLDIPLVYGGTATGMQDYASGPTMVGFAQGATTASFTVSIRDDADIEGAETIQITLQSGAGATPATPSQHVITIDDNDQDTTVSPEVEITSPMDGALVFTAPLQVTGWCEYGATLTIEVSEGFSGMSPSPTPPPVNCVACTTAEHPDCGTGPNQRGKFQFSVAPGGSSGPRSLTISQEDAAMNAGTPVTLNLQWAPLPTAGAYIKASNTNAQDTFGFSVDIDGDTMVVGAPSEASAATGVGGNQADNSLTNAGAVYVFVRSGGAWTQQAYIKASNTGANDAFGSSVALSGDTLVVGAPQESSSATGVNGDGLNDAAPASGAAYVFVRTGSQWSQQAYIKASNTGFVDLFGVSVAIDGGVVVVGASGESSSATGVGGNQTDDSAVSAGAAYVFERAGTMWSQTAYLKASNTEANDSFGSAVAVSGDVVAVGAPFEAGTATNINGNGSSNGASGAGAVYLFTGNSGVWSAGPYVKASNTDAGDGFGTSVALAPGTLVVGAPFEQSNATGVNGNQSSNAADSAGAVYVLREVGGTWQHHAYLKASNTGAQDHFGASVAISQDTILVGADSEDGTGTGVNPNGATDTASGAGAAYVFQHALDGSWQPKAYLKASNTGAGDNFGRWVSVSGTTLVVSAPYEASNATGIDGNQMSNTAASSGAVYTFDGR